MIVGEQKPLEEIKGLVAEAEKILVVGCGTCVTVSFAGGTKEVGVLASSLRMATKLDGDTKQFDEVTVQRQCEWEYLDEIAEQVGEVDVVLSLGCGVGVQAMVEQGIRDDYIVLVGGAPLNEEFGRAIGADAYCRDAAVAVETARRFVQGAA